MITRKKIIHENEQPNRWLISYADFITLLFAFFVVMYAISSINQQKYFALNTSLNLAFKHDKNSRNNAQAPNKKTSFTKNLSQKNRLDIGSRLADELYPFIIDGKVRIIESNVALRLDMQESLLFIKSSKIFNRDAKGILEKIATILKKSESQIIIEGHTDNTMIEEEAFSSNWSYSAARATMLAETLNNAGIHSNRLSVIGFGASLPVEANNSPLGRARNRRVSIVIPTELDESYEGLEISPKKMD
jgi:chemotaxis protein MotB